ncbi:short-chain dehydrogenase [Cytobacillus sp. FJAT-54145]|uniref:Short-chain dehydrogenase n=1 Tax=Cytobacillus spartinae TaxID=3299023 RepID=A0ABW6KHC1_9BACI
MKKHALVIGGTGMLKGVVTWLHEQGYVVSVVGRQKHKYERMMKETELDSRVHFIEVDYFILEDFKQKIIEAVDTMGPISLCITWMRSDAVTGFDWLKSYLMEEKADVELYEIKGSHASRIPFSPVTSEAFVWKRIILGFKIEGKESRWLMNKEISNGVIESIENKHDLHIVGVVEPWGNRPSY